MMSRYLTFRGLMHRVESMVVVAIHLVRFGPALLGVMSDAVGVGLVGKGRDSLGLEFS